MGPGSRPGKPSQQTGNLVILNQVQDDAKTPLPIRFRTTRTTGPRVGKYVFSWATFSSQTDNNDAVRVVGHREKP